MTRANPKLQGLLSYLCISHYLHDGLVFNPYIEKYNLENLEELDAKITEVLDLLSFPLEVVTRNRLRVTTSSGKLNKSNTSVILASNSSKFSKLYFSM